MGTTFSYHGWLIDLHYTEGGYRFRCWRADGTVVIDDRELYPNCRQALEVAKRRADLESTCLALLRFLDDIRGRCYYLTGNDHEALSNSIVQFCRCGSF